MNPMTTHSWDRVIRLYRSLEQYGWTYIPAFTKLLPEIKSRAVELNLIPVTTHERLLLSRSSEYPDFFENEHIVLCPQENETVVIEVWDRKYHKTSTSCYRFDEAVPHILKTIDDHLGPERAA